MTTTRTWYHRLSQWWKEGSNGVPETSPAPEERRELLHLHRFSREEMDIALMTALAYRDARPSLGLVTIVNRALRVVEWHRREKNRLARRKPAVRVSIPDLNEREPVLSETPQ